MKKYNTFCFKFKTRFALGLILFFLVFGISLTKAQDSNQKDFFKKKTFKMTTLTFGGNGVNVTKINNQVTVMTGGRGSATFNNRFTIGGGGWGMIKAIGTGRIIDNPPIDPFFAVFLGSFFLCFAYLQFLSGFNIKRYAFNVGCLVIGRSFYVVQLYTSKCRDHKTNSTM